MLHLENEGFLDKVTILRGYKDVARELKDLNLPIAEIDGVFMVHKIPSFAFKKAPSVQTVKSDGTHEPVLATPIDVASPVKPLPSLGKQPKYLDPTKVSRFFRVFFPAP